MMDWQRAASPVAAWAVVVLALGGSLALVRANGARWIDEGLRGGGDPCLAADILLERAHGRYRPLAREARGLSGGEEPGASSFGVLAGNDDLERAREDLEAAAAACPTLPGVHHLLADLAWWEGRRAASFHHLGLEAELDGRWGLALANHQAAMEIDPGNDAFVLAAAGCAIQRREFELASSLLARLPQNALLEAAPQRLEAAALLGRGDAAGAFEALQRVVELAPADLAAHALLLDAATRAGMAGDGASLSWSVLRDEPGATAQLLHRCGLLLLADGRDAEALAPLEAAERLASHSVDLLASVAEAHARLGRTRVARAVAERAASIDARRLRELAQDPAFPSLAPLLDSPSPPG